MKKIIEWLKLNWIHIIVWLIIIGIILLVLIMSYYFGEEGEWWRATNITKGWIGGKGVFYLLITS